MLRPDAAWCSHCQLEEPMLLATAIDHRREEHADCLSCKVECLLFASILEGGETFHFSDPFKR